MDIIGKIKGIKYKILFSDELAEMELGTFDINKIPSSCLIHDNKHIFAISKWVSPKRTRSYPFERVYNTLNISKKITVIPILKDEGAKGDRDYIQWDTISLMSLLDIFVIFAYYQCAEVNPRNKQKITNQQFDNKYIVSKIKEIKEYHSSALHWNLNELNSNFHSIIDAVKKSYLSIEKKTNVKLHDFTGIDYFKTKIGNDISIFMDFSRDKAKKAQSREYITVQPKEKLFTLSKAKITISNYLGGQYFLTVDEISIEKNTVKLIEAKHSNSSLLPSKSDIKDGLLKMILYSNLLDVTVNEKQFKSKAVLCLTSSKIKGMIDSHSSKEEIAFFFKTNSFTPQQEETVKIIIQESIKNKFTIQIQYIPNDKKPTTISRR